MKHMMTIGHTSSFVTRACNCGRWGCITRPNSAVLVTFQSGRAEWYTAECAADVLRDDASCVRSVWMTPASQRRMERERTAEAAMVSLLAGVAA